MAVQVTKQMSINEVIPVDRRVAPILMEAGMHCIGCPMAMAESIEMACASHGVDADAIVEKINAFLSEND